MTTPYLDKPAMTAWEAEALAALKYARNVLWAISLTKLPENEAMLIRDCRRVVQEAITEHVNRMLNSRSAACDV